MSVIDGAFESLLDLVPKAFAAADSELAEYLQKEVIGKIEIVRGKCQELERQLLSRTARDVTMGQPAIEGGDMAMQLLYVAAKGSIEKGVITESLKRAVETVDRRLEAGRADA